jgi:hypothetical protein
VDHQETLGADKGYDTWKFMADQNISDITPNVAQNIQTRRSSPIDGPTASHHGLNQGNNNKKRIELMLWAGATQTSRPIKGGSSLLGACGGL